MFRIVVLRDKEQVINLLKEDGWTIGSWRNDNEMIVRATHKNVRTQQDMRHRLHKIGLLTSVKIKVEEVMLQEA